MSEHLIAFGSELKALGDGRVGGYLVVFTDEDNPDLTGDFFAKDTDFGLDEPRKVGVYYQHGRDEHLKSRRLGYAELSVTDAGVWMEAQLALRDEYERSIYDLIEAGKMGLSSGAVGHLVEREKTSKAYKITRWEIGEASITPTPAEPKTSVIPLKSLFPDEDEQAPETEPDASDDAVAVVASPVIEVSGVNEGETDMSEENNGRMDALEGSVKGLGDQINRVLSMLETAPAQSLGYVSADGGTADSHVKSFGDWALAVMRRDEKRLKNVYKATMVEGTGSTGGYMVPTEFSTMLLTAAEQASAIYARVARMNVSAPTGRLPYLDTFTAPTAGVGQTAQAGKVTTAKRTEAASYTETNAEFEQLEYRINDIASGLVRVSRELRADSVIAIEQLLTLLIRNAVSARLEYYILRGSGVGEPLGILNAPAKIDISPDSDGVFAYLDAVEMVTRFKAAGGSPLWIMHPGMLQDVAAFQVAASSPTTWTQDIASPLRGTLLGYPMVTSEHSSNPDSSGCVILADLQAYLFFQKGDLYVDFSDQRYFDTGEDAWRFGIRADGRPWWKGAQTLGSPTAYTVSPFVNFND